MLRAVCQISYRSEELAMACPDTLSVNEKIVSEESRGKSLRAMLFEKLLGDKLMSRSIATMPKIVA